jgi:hypothetical protein
MRRLGPLLVVLGVLAAGAARADVVFSDGELAASSFLVAEVELAEGGSFTTAQELNGNPGSALLVQTVLAPSTGASQYTVVFLRRGAYDPMLDGGFASIDYDEDHKLVAGGGGGQATGPALRQNGSIFVSNLGSTPERDWTRTRATGLTVDDFVRISGPQQVLNFSTGAPKIEVGFFRANGHSAAGGGEGSQTVAIDNWRVALVPGCTADADCDDGDACTTETCVAATCRRERLNCNDNDPCTTDACSQGVCSNLALGCDDGITCTVDTCVAGSCLHDLTADALEVQARIGSFLGLLDRPPCSVETPQLRLVRKLGKKLRRARTKIGQADGAVAVPRITRLLERARVLVDAARKALAKGEVAGSVSPACGAELAAFLDDLSICVQGVPRR